MNETNHQHDQLPPGALDLIDRWVIQAVSEAEEQERRLKIEHDGTTVTIYEYLTASARDQDKWVWGPVAQLRYRPEASPNNAWALFAADIEDNWYPYEVFDQPGSKFTGTLEDALADIEEDRDGMFFGTF